MTTLGTAIRAWLQGRSIALVAAGKVLDDEAEIEAVEDLADLALEVVDPRRRPTAEIPAEVVAHLAALCGAPDTPGA